MNSEERERGTDNVEIESLSSSFNEWADQVQEEMNNNPRSGNVFNSTFQFRDFQTLPLSPPVNQTAQEPQVQQSHQISRHNNESRREAQEGEEVSAMAALDVITNYFDPEETGTEEEANAVSSYYEPQQQRGTLIKGIHDGSDQDNESLSRESEELGSYDEETRFSESYLRDREYLMKIGLLQPSWGYPPLDDDDDNDDNGYTSYEIIERRKKQRARLKSKHDEQKQKYRWKYPMKGYSFNTLPVINFNEFGLNPTTSKKYHLSSKELMIFQNGKSYLYSMKKDRIVGEFDFRGQLFHRLYLCNLDPRILKLVHENKWREISKLVNTYIPLK